MHSFWWSVLVAIATILLLSLAKLVFGAGITWMIAVCGLTFCVGAL